MISNLSYGANQNLRLEIDPDALVADCLPPPGMNQADTVNAAARAAQSPLDFPPLCQATVPGDRVVIALGPDVPQAAEVVAAIVPELLAGGNAPAHISVLQAPISFSAHQPRGESGCAHDPRNSLPADLRETVKWITHHPSEQGEMSYLAADAQGAPLYLNRLLCDADLVVPVGCLRLHYSNSLNGEAGLWNDSIYPTFGDRNTLDHFSANGVPLTVGQVAHRHRQVDQVAWLLGIQITAQVIPGNGERAFRVLAGTPEAVFLQGHALCRSAWQQQVPQRAGLVVAGIGGGSAFQTWNHVGRALEAALRVVSEGGAIVLCTQLNEPWGPALKLLASSTDLAATQALLRKQRSADAALARRMAELVERASVYLLSALPEESVSPLGFAHIHDASEFSRLISHHDSCILLPDAQHAWPVVTGEED
ncbi:MAG TPA: lactate racemase domain-containing protein [Pirellulales bacterium]|jgi:nickel-dependent lactate racemase|nr:lactate racemase domain-containing protein [Pirellulales bacterium]